MMSATFIRKKFLRVRLLVVRISIQRLRRFTTRAITAQSFAELKKVSPKLCQVPVSLPVKQPTSLDFAIRD
jgi:hypothetical protein